MVEHTKNTAKLVISSFLCLSQHLKLKAQSPGLVIKTPREEAVAIG